MRLTIRLKRTLGVAVLSLTVFMSACVNPNKLPGLRSQAEREEARLNRESEEAVKNSPLLQQLDSFCTSHVPPALGFVGVNRHLDFRGRKALIYGYHSNASFATVKQEYKNRLLPEGWKVTREEDHTWGESRLTLVGGSYSIDIYDVGSGQGVNYKIHCESLADVK